jgi:hypothetical protein
MAKISELPSTWEVKRIFSAGLQETHKSTEMPPRRVRVQPEPKEPTCIRIILPP